MRGFLFALTVLIFFALLLSFVLAAKSAEGESAKRTAEARDARKIRFVFEDVREDFATNIGLTILQENNTLIFYDHLPANLNVPNALKAYDAFIQAYYLTPELSIAFLDEADNPINFATMSDDIIIQPWGIKYDYLDDWGKRVLRIEWPNTSAYGALGALNLSFDFPNASFEYSPTPGNASHFKWSPDFTVPSCGNLPNCMNFSLRIKDNMSQVYSCPGPICNATGFRTNKKSTLDVKMVPCWMELTLGDTGGGDDIALVRLHEPGNPGVPCSRDTDVVIRFNFNTTEFYVVFPSKLMVRDINYGFEKRDRLRGG
ncbi:MAG: hypothetical protein QXG98_01730 [Candidatus Micrarchaeia archaeon]